MEGRATARFQLLGAAQNDIRWQSVAAEATQEQPGALEERAISLGHLQPLSSAAAVITLVGATKKCVSDHKDARMPVGSAPWD